MADYKLSIFIYMAGIVMFIIGFSDYRLSKVKLFIAAIFWLPLLLFALYVGFIDEL